MNRFEELSQQAADEGLALIDRPFQSSRIKGLYCDGVIALNSSLETTAERACILAEEIGHHYTSFGNIIDMDDAGNCKQEYRARAWAFNKSIGLEGLISAYKNGCQNLYDTSTYLCVTEEFLKEALECYRRKYGVCQSVDNYIVYFEQFLAIAEITDI